MRLDELEEHIEPCDYGGGGMTKELCPSCAVEMPLENANLLERLLNLRLYKSY